MNPQTILRENLERLMNAHPDLASQLKVKARAKHRLSQSTLSRVLSGKVGCRIDTLDQIAEVFGLEAWQLLTPMLDPQHPPLLRAINHEERELYERLRLAAQELADYKKSKP